MTLCGFVNLKIIHIHTSSEHLPLLKLVRKLTPPSTEVTREVTVVTVVTFPKNPRND
jgi:hypothetical protein